MYTIHTIKHNISNEHLDAPEGQQLSFLASKIAFGPPKGGQIIPISAPKTTPTPRGQRTRFKKSFFVGDTLTDGYAAKDNKLNFVKAKYGYGDRQNWDDIPVHKSIDEIVELMLI